MHPSVDFWSGVLLSPEQVFFTGHPTDVTSFHEGGTSIHLLCLHSWQVICLFLTGTISTVESWSTRLPPQPSLHRDRMSSQETPGRSSWLCPESSQTVLQSRLSDPGCEWAPHTFCLWSISICICWAWTTSVSSSSQILLVWPDILPLCPAMLHSPQGHFLCGPSVWPCELAPTRRWTAPPRATGTDISAQSGFLHHCPAEVGWQSGWQSHEGSQTHWSQKRSFCLFASHENVWLNPSPWQTGQSSLVPRCCSSGGNFHRCHWTRAGPL